MLGRRFGEDPDWGGDGRHDSPFVVVTCGIVLPLVFVALAGLVLWSGGVVLHARLGGAVRYDSFHSIASAVFACVGMALMFLAHFGLTNWFPNNYRYQYVAAAGVVMACGGIIWFLVAALMK